MDLDVFDVCVAVPVIRQLHIDAGLYRCADAVVVEIERQVPGRCVGHRRDTLMRRDAWRTARKHRGRYRQVDVHDERKVHARAEIRADRAMGVEVVFGREGGRELFERTETPDALDRHSVFLRHGQYQLGRPLRGEVVLKVDVRNPL